MSIILEGIDMPKEGEWLEIIVKPTKEVIVDTIRYRDNALLKTEYGLAIQIPKGHGRLIDADLLKDTIRDSVPAYTIGVKIPTFGDTQIMSAINVMPTILEAEE